MTLLSVSLSSRGLYSKPLYSQPQTRGSYRPAFGFSNNNQTYTRVVKNYYRDIDVNNIDNALEPFDDNAVYHRSGHEPLIGKPAIETFYKQVRGLKGMHYVVDQKMTSGWPQSVERGNSVPEGPTISTRGSFVGTNHGEPI